MALRRSIAIMMGTAALLAAGPALADVKAGVDAWSRGDWNGAVAQWQGPAQANDPDALFNLGQAYRLGRGVPQDAAKARDYYARAAKLGHLRAADTYGIMLFQDGDRKTAMPYIENAARRGNPSAEYLLGIALFNGDLMPKDWVRAYALLTMANAQQLPQAKVALAQMDGYIPLDQRQQAADMAGRLQNEADASRARELAAADLSAGDEPAALAASAPLATASPRIPQPIRSVEVDPSVDAARDAVRQAMLATGTESPAEAGADYARGGSAAPRQQVAIAQPRQQVAIAPPPRPAPAERPPATPQPAPRPAASAAGAWKVQLGVFSVAGNAERLWTEVQGIAGVSGKNRLLVPAGKLTKLLAGGYASEGEAAAACQRLKQAGHECVVTK